MNTRLVIIGLVAVLLLCVVAIAGLALQAKPIPDVLQNIAVGTLTGLVGLLVPTRSVPVDPTQP